MTRSCMVCVVVLLLAAQAEAQYRRVNRDSSGRPSIVKMTPVPKKEKPTEPKKPAPKPAPRRSDAAELLRKSEAANDPNEETFRRNLRKQIAAQPEKKSGSYVGSRWYTPQQLAEKAAARIELSDRWLAQYEIDKAKRAEEQVELQKQQAAQQAAQQQAYLDWHERYIADAPVRAEMAAEQAAFANQQAAFQQRQAAKDLRWAAQDLERASENWSDWSRPRWPARPGFGVEAQRQGYYDAYYDSVYDAAYGRVDTSWMFRY